MKKILGLDLGTNSIGWALVEIDHENNTVKILGLGSRILPMDAGEISDFEKSGKIKSSAAQRTEKRGSRRLNERYLLRRDRLHIVLDLLEALPTHYRLEINFTNSKGEKSGKFREYKEPKLAYFPKQKEQKAKFLFIDSYKEMLNDIGNENIKNQKGNRIPYDWTLYYLRQKALSEKITLEELAWVLLSYNQKRGYEKIEVEDKSTKKNEFIEELDLRVIEVISKLDKTNKRFFEVHLEGNDNLIYNEYSDVQMTFKDDLKEIIKTSKVDDQGNIDEKKTEFTVVDIYPLEIKKVNYENEDGKHKYTLTYQNGWEEIKSPQNYIFKYKNALYKSYDYVVETTYDIKGNIKLQQGKERKLREPNFSDNSSDWTLLKKKTEKEALTFNIEKGYKNKDGSAIEYISPKIYEVLKNDARTGKRTKIIGGMFQVVDRNFYRTELNQIITTQKQFHTTLKDEEVFEKCVKTLYPKNKSHQETLLKNKNAIQYLLIEDVLLYQRPLKSKKSEISNCKYEIQYWKKVLDIPGNSIEETDIATGEIKSKKEPVYIKVASASHPYFQEFRIWDKLHNLKLIQLEKEVEGKLMTNQDITKDYFKSEKEYQELFEELNNRKSLSQDQFLAYCKKKFKIDYKAKDSNYAWNFPEDEEIKGNETRVSFATRFNRCGFTKYTDFLTQEKERELWHYLYSVSFKERTVNDNKSAVTFFNNFFKNFTIDEEVKEKIIKDFVNYPKFASRYCAYSEKALKKLIPLIQKGDKEKKYAWESESWYVKWKNSNEIRKEEILKRLSKIDFTAENTNYSVVVETNVDLQKGEIPFPKGLFNTFRNFEKQEDFSSLNLTQASYLVYGRHSELAQAKYWTSPNDIRKQLHQELKQHSLNNPVAEKVLLETMQIVADIWDYYGKGVENYFSRIHLEVGRELKKSAKEKESESKRMSENRAQNKRIRQVLEEFLTNSEYNANPKNSDHFERLKIVEEGADHTNNINRDFFNDKPYSKKDIENILKKPHISKEDFEKYKLWIEQGYRSPYSGQMIKLTELFDGTKYNLDHIFPQASITNNSLSNKVVVEVALNKLKGDRTARAFIQTQKGQSYLNIPVCSDDEYVNIVKTQFSGTKRYILLSKDIPKGFTDSQMNNARHIARKAMELLSHIVREPGEVEFRSKNVLPVTGNVTNELKRAWKLDEVWRELVSPRFIRMNELTKSNLFGEWQVSKNGQKYFDCNLDAIIRDKDESYDIKRIDHRHHALDALIVALCTEDYVNYINNINANAKSENYGKQRQIEEYRKTLKKKIKFIKRDDEKDENNWFYMLPGEIRQKNEDNSYRDSVLEMHYLYKDFDSFGQGYREMILTALKDIIPSFKQPKSNIRKTSNKYFSYYDEEKQLKIKKSLTKQIDVNSKKFQSTNKRNIAIRKEMHDENPYGKSIVDFEWKKIEDGLGNWEFIIDEEIKLQVVDALAINDNNIAKTKKYLKQSPITNNLGEPILETCFKVEDPKDLIAFTIRKDLTEITDFKRLKKINNLDLQKELLTHLAKYHTIKVPLEDAKDLIEYAIEYDELKSICKEDSQFDSIDNLTEFLVNNKFKYKNSEYKFVNLFIKNVSEKIDIHKYELKKNFKLAFSPTGIEELNNGRTTPIKKVKLFERSEGKYSLGKNLGNKHKMVKGANSLFIIDRKTKDLYSTIKLNDEIEKYYEGNKLNFKDTMDHFSLIAGDLVYVPTEKEISNLNSIEFFRINHNRIYKFIKSSGKTADFIQCYIAATIYNYDEKKEKDKSTLKQLLERTTMEFKPGSLLKNEVGFGSAHDKNQNMMDGITQIKARCIKLKVDRLGNISKA